ncbi:hypothetical protein JDV02_004500 [Purpureocillium takamizusanense]|uniref:Uncharacterized protein n=1 Tax=Purpureocillium takamizusanense TaxID=2060973 RepID=A0A9Q8QE11_9HYPO|nr:uncharacterized protein JDV02_004500 [Purpureocillium takamizusanense]UNI18218.1 hypothetical protein JDV02_004500 [Purpureocillium takamizusanense]
MDSPRDQARLRQGLNPLTTSSLGLYNAQLNTPISAVSMASSHIHSAHTPASAIQPYNPQEWVPPSGPAPPATMPSTDRTRQFEAQAPPPPYSPPRSQQQRPMSTAFEHAISSTPPPRIATIAVHRPSPEPSAARAFPPPPGASGRGGSRERRFGLPSLSRRRDNDQVSQSPEPQPQPLGGPFRRSMGPASLYQEPERMTSPSSAAVNPVPPSARRAASTGAIDTPTSARSRSTSQTRWEPGMPLPPPPPGPPPSSSRSQSVQSMDRNSVPIISPPTRRAPPSGIASLGPVPPTPANWVDGDALPSQRPRSKSPGLTIDTATASSSQDVPEPLTSSGSASGGLNRARAVRHDKTIIQRRTESRNRHTSQGSLDATTRPHEIPDIVVPRSPDSHKLSQPKANARSGGLLPDLYQAGESSSQADSRNSTPRAPNSAKLPLLQTATPPFSPSAIKSGQPANTSQSAIVPKALPTPPPQTRSASCSRPRDGSRPPASASTPVSKHTVVTQNASQFAAAAVERFRAFAEREAAVSSDADRVRLFADFFVNESRIRRERYSAAISAMGSEIFDLSRDLFRPMTPPRRDSATSQEQWTPASTDPAASYRDSVGSAPRGEGLSNSAPTSANLPMSPSAGATNNGTWAASNYMPSLSPILSMSVSDNYENGSSRGRPPSRWWESDSQGDGSRVFERSKRESKYMGVPKDQWVEEEAAGGSDYRSSSEYPPEKTGWHDQSEPVKTPQPLHSATTTPVDPSISPSSYKSGSLDVSRLVTMPPPYPRHHPAVNNNHPELATIRSSVRALGDLSEIDNAKERFAIASSKRREEFSQAASQRRQSLRANLQREINAGNLGYADAAAIESDSQDQEKDKKKELEKSEYELFQNEVILPLNDLLTGRIARAKDLFDELSRHLFDSGRIDADMPQEEGDDRPELLEKLTLLKWIFEMRETLHRAIYDILSDRNARYCEVVMTPYRLSGNTDKLKSAEAFFAEDAAKREYAFSNEVLDRAREFRTVMEKSVDRGVALQLSAFWDIAPPLRELLDSIPNDLEGFRIQIPPSELDENPTYREHPLQYLFSLLQHMEKSTYQFIESHTNLLCLLHEVKGAVVNAKARVLASQPEEMDGTRLRPEDREERARAMRQSEDMRLTEDLKEKVRVVQDQWNGALGEGIKNVKERTATWLLESGGWDEALEESAVFGGA